MGVLLGKTFLRFAADVGSLSAGNGTSFSRRIPAPDRRGCDDVRFVHLPASPRLASHPPALPEANPAEAPGGSPPATHPVLPEHYLGGHSKGALPRSPRSQPNSHPDTRPGRHAPSASPDSPWDLRGKRGGVAMKPQEILTRREDEGHDSIPPAQSERAYRSQPTACSLRQAISRLRRSSSTSSSLKPQASLLPLLEDYKHGDGDQRESDQ